MNIKPSAITSTFQLFRTLWAKKREPTHYWSPLWQSKIQGFLCLAAFSCTENMNWNVRRILASTISFPLFTVQFFYCAFDHQMVIINTYGNNVYWNRITRFGIVDIFQFRRFSRVSSCDLQKIENMPWVISAQCPEWTMNDYHQSGRKLKTIKSFTNDSVHLHTKSCKLDNE